MTTYILLLRGINVGGHNPMKMADLLALASTLSCTSCKSYIQSGNLVFKSNENDINALQTQWKEAIQKQFGFKVPVIIRTQAAWTDMISQNPFLNRAQVDSAKLHATLLNCPPDNAILNTLPPSPHHGDDYAIIHQVAYLHCTNPYHKSKLSNAFFESKLKCEATTRNWRTIVHLQHLAESI